MTGDTVGDPFKDTSGPSMNILIKLMRIVSLVIAPLIAVPGTEVGGLGPTRAPAVESAAPAAAAVVPVPPAAMPASPAETVSPDALAPAPVRR